VNSIWFVEVLTNWCVPPNSYSWTVYNLVESFSSSSSSVQKKFKEIQSSKKEFKEVQQFSSAVR
jgi:hypothetical protein